MTILPTLIKADILKSNISGNTALFQKSDIISNTISWWIVPGIKGFEWMDCVFLLFNSLDMKNWHSIHIVLRLNSPQVFWNKPLRRSTVHCSWICYNKIYLNIVIGVKIFCRLCSYLIALHWLIHQLFFSHSSSLLADSILLLSSGCDISSSDSVLCLYNDCQHCCQGLNQIRHTQDSYIFIFSYMTSLCKAIT